MFGVPQRCGKSDRDGLIDVPRQGVLGFAFMNGGFRAVTRLGQLERASFGHLLPDEIIIYQHDFMSSNISTQIQYTIVLLRKAIRRKQSR